MPRTIVTTVITATALCGCMTQAPHNTVASAPVMQLDTSDPLYQRLAGKRFSTDTETIIFNADGTATGEGEAAGYQPTWWIEDGKFCRTVTAPAKWVGTGCRTVTFSGNTATFTRDDGSSFTYTSIS